MISREPSELFELAQQGNRTALARIISLIERGRSDAETISSLAFATATWPYTIGITGAPGSGKSTITNELLSVVRKLDHEVAVLAIDPSSPFSGGAILGDRIHMQQHILDKGVYIRSMATRGHFGGLSVAVPEASRLLGAVGFPFVFIETVGVGQVEVEIVNESDTTIVVVNPGWGDAIQANKAGLMEIADIFIINKCDRGGVRETRRDLEGMLELSDFPLYRPPILETTATSNTGIDAVMDAIIAHKTFLENNGSIHELRLQRVKSELRRVVEELIKTKVDAGLEEATNKDLVWSIFTGNHGLMASAQEILQDLWKN